MFRQVPWMFQQAASYGSCPKPAVLFCAITLSAGYENILNAISDHVLLCLALLLLPLCVLLCPLLCAPGPLDVYSGSLIRQFRVRQKVELNDRLSASAGLFYDLSAGNLGPWGTLTYKLDPTNKQSKSRIGGCRGAKYTRVVPTVLTR
jgi:hypothetical protein